VFEGDVGNVVLPSHTLMEMLSVLLLLLRH